MRSQMQHIIFESIDWMSIKLTGASLPFLLLINPNIGATLAIIMFSTTIIYNGIRIFKELKNKK